MATIRICDVCGARAFPLVPVTVPGRVHPHDGEPISATETIDVCLACLPKLPGLRTDTTREVLAARFLFLKAEN